MIQILLLSLDDPGDGELFESIYRRCVKPAFCAAYEILHSEQDAQDAVQDTFFWAAEHFSRIKRIEDEYVLSYICRAARNRALNIKNRSARIARISEPMTEDIPEDFDENELLRLCGEDRVSVIERCIQSLPDIYRDALTLHFAEDLSAPKIARILGIKRETAKKRLVRGKAMLRELLEKEGLKNE